MEEGGERGRRKVPGEKGTPRMTGRNKSGRVAAAYDDPRSTAGSRHSPVQRPENIPVNGILGHSNKNKQG